MNCRVIADVSQKLTIGWKKNNLDIGQEGFADSDRMHVDENNALIIKNLTFSDSGTYTCVATTAASGDTDSGLLSVLGIRPRLAAAERMSDFVDGSVVTIDCQLLEGYPAPGVSWFKDGLDIDFSSGSVTIGHV